MTTAIVPQNQDSIISDVVTAGDLKALSPAQRVNYYNAVCQSMGLNPLTKPFDYISLNGKLTLYATKGASDQLRKINGVSLGKPDVEFADDVIIVTISATDASGRTDTDVGVVSISNARGDQKANAIMKAITKAKRRVTLSICGLGWLDESEIETIPARVVQRPMVDTTTGELLEGEVVTQSDNGQPAPPPLPDDELVIAETPAADFIQAAAALLGSSVEVVKGMLRALGHTSIPGNGKTQERLELYRELRQAKEDGDRVPEDAPLFEEDGPGGAYQE